MDAAVRHLRNTPRRLLPTGRCDEAHSVTTEPENGRTEEPSAAAAAASVSIRQRCVSVTLSHVDVASVRPDEVVGVRDAACYRQSRSVSRVSENEEQREGGRPEKKAEIRREL